MRRDVLDQILADRRSGRAAVVATRLATGEQIVLHPDEPGQPPDVEPEIWTAARAALANDRSDRVGDVFLHVHNSPLRLLIVGAVHVAQALAGMAALTGFTVVVVDPRRAFATSERFPGVSLCTDWPDEAFAALAPDRRTAVVTLTHDPKLDDPALIATLRSPAFYVGALGSKKTHAARCERLRAAGFGDDAIARIHGPVGLDIDARTSGEIAVSILADVVKGLRAER